MNLLCICEPDRYQRPQLDVPATYQAFASDRHLNLFHTPTNTVHSSRFALAAVVPQHLSHQNFLSLNSAATQRFPLTHFDVAFCRTLKPFPHGYLDHLARWANHLKFVNHPLGIRRQIEPDFLLQIANNWMPAAISTADPAEAEAFFQQYGTIVAKRANSCGGRGVFKVSYSDRQFDVDNISLGLRQFASFSEVMTYLQPHPQSALQFVRYLPTVRAGDKRVVVVDGEIYGAYVRRSRSGHWVQNVSLDGECFLADIRDAERYAIAQTVPFYKALGLHTLGYDFLQDERGEWTIGEINAGNIGGFARLQQMTGEPVCDRLASWLIEFSNRPSGQANHPVLSPAIQR
ncbi:MAG: hypothetical protein AAF268_05335 [Cyanobacteria bacterium P01_A01_bin.3]